MATTVQTTCAYCGVGCGVTARIAGSHANHLIDITGDVNHPANRGKLCSKGMALGDTVNLAGRLLQPKVRGQNASWATAINTVAEGFKQTIKQYGPDSVAFYVSGQLLTEDYYVANKLMKGYIGSANIDTNSRLCMSSAVAGHIRAFGADCVPACYDDLEDADLTVLVGSNMAWCHPIVFQRILQAKAQNPHKRIVTIDPRRTPTAEQSDVFLPIKPGSDVLLFNGLLAFLQQHQHVDTDYIRQFTEHFDVTVAHAIAEAGQVADVAQQCGLAEADLRWFYQQFADTAKTVTVFSQGVNQSSCGSDKVNAIINCHLATGRVGQPGASPFSITGQPNAMGGREVGGLANMLAAHMGFADPQHAARLQAFWGSPTIARQAGRKAVDLFDAVYDGKVKAIWIMATNPAVSLPHAQKVRQALARCDFVAVSDCMANTDSSRYADVLLPATGWAEKDGTVTNSDRCISRQRAFLPPAGAARHDWQIICAVAQRMGYAGFEYQSQHDIFTEHAALSGYQNNGSRDFDISAYQQLTADEYDALTPTPWPITQDQPQGTARLLGNGQFYTASGKGQFVPVHYRAPANAVQEEYPLILNTGRIRDHWHTMTRTGKSAKLSGHITEPLLALHPADAQKYRIEDGRIVHITSAWGSAKARVHISDCQRQGEVFMPIHWNDQFAADSVVGQLVNPATDPLSGQPEFKHTPVNIQAVEVVQYGFILSRQPLRHALLSQHSVYWVTVTGQLFYRYELAYDRNMSEIDNWAKKLFEVSENKDQSIDWLDYYDQYTGLYRAAHVYDGQLMGCVFLGSEPNLPSRSWLASLFAEDEISSQQRCSLLLAESPDPSADVGPIVCSCFTVGQNVIRQAIAEQGLTTVADIGACLQAGTNCGSCVPELSALLRLC